MTAQPSHYCYTEAATLSNPFKARVEGGLECYKTKVILESHQEIILDLYTSTQLPRLPEMYLHHPEAMEVRFTPGSKPVEFPHLQTEAINKLIGRTESRVGLTLSWENNWTHPNQGVWVKKESLPRALQSVHVCKTIPQGWHESLTVKQFAVILYDCLNHTVSDGRNGQGTIENGSVWLNVRTCRNREW